MSLLSVIWKSQVGVNKLITKNYKLQMSEWLFSQDQGEDNVVFLMYTLKTLYTQRKIV